MSVIIDKATGFPVKPQPKTIYWLVCWNAYCDSRSCIEAMSREELWTKYEDGRNRKIYGSIYESGTRTGIDPQERKEYKAAVDRILSHSCYMPPVEDLKLLSWAKKLDPSRYAEIDPQAGSWKMTRDRLEDIRNDKCGEEYHRFWKENGYLKPYGPGKPSGSV